MPKLVDERELVIPGEAVYEGMDYLPGNGVYRSGDKVYSKYLGVVEYRNNRLIRVVPLRGKYLPKENDLVIGEISRISHSSWTVDLNSPYDGVLPLSEAVDEFRDAGDISRFFDIGDVVVVKVKRVTRSMDVLLSMRDRRAKKLSGGQIVCVPHTKVPRIIGKRGTMINVIKDKTNCIIIVGQNGRIWIRGENEDLAALAIRKIDAEAHSSGLTQRITDFLDLEVDSTSLKASKTQKSTLNPNQNQPKPNQKTEASRGESDGAQR